MQNMSTEISVCIMQGNNPTDWDIIYLFQCVVNTQMFVLCSNVANKS